MLLKFSTSGGGLTCSFVLGEVDGAVAATSQLLLEKVFLNPAKQFLTLGNHVGAPEKVLLGPR